MCCGGRVETIDFGCKSSARRVGSADGFCGADCGSAWLGTAPVSGGSCCEDGGSTSVGGELRAAWRSAIRTSTTPCKVSKVLCTAICSSIGTVMDSYGVW